jgi:hypothetical protein
MIIRMKDPTPGIWRLQVYAEGDLPLTYHIWLPIEPFLQADTYFVKPNPYTLITSPGTAIGPITITAYNHTNQSIYQYSSRGYTRTGIVKPELAAPGVDISGPSVSGGYEVRSGTSIAAAHAAGIAALLLEWGIVKEQKLDIDTIEIKKFLIRGARREANITYPNQEWGYGIIDIYNTFLSLTNPS